MIQAKVRELLSSLPGLKARAIGGSGFNCLNKIIYPLKETDTIRASAVAFYFSIVVGRAVVACQFFAGLYISQSIKLNMIAAHTHKCVGRTGVVYVSQFIAIY